jgi:hypothetical protein
MTTHTDPDFARAIECISASEDSDGSYVYYDNGMRRYYRVDAGDIVVLGEMLAAGTVDAYSHWCAQTTAEEMPAEWTP